MLRFVLLVVMSATLCGATHEALAGDQIWQVENFNATVPMSALMSLQFEARLDLLGPTSDGKTSFQVYRQHVGYVGDYLDDANIAYVVTVSDLQVFMQNEDEVANRSRSARSGTCVANSCPLPLSDEYMTYAQMEYYLQSISVSHSDRVSLASIGTTYEGRDIWMVNIKSADQNTDKGLFIDAGIHAREWVASAAALHIIQHILDNPTFTNGLEFNIIPLANPDGFVYTQLNRMWRKNRVVRSGSNCRGVDLNRNFDHKWGFSGTSSNRCSIIYKGPTPFSEAESVAMKTQVLATPNLAFFISIHSYGQLILYPWGYAISAYADNNDELHAMGNKIHDAIASHAGKDYEVMKSTDLYLASGTTKDWAMSTGVPYSYTWELRDKGYYGFLLPASQILDTSTETWLGLRAAIKRMRLLDFHSQRIVIA